MFDQIFFPLCFSIIPQDISAGNSPRVSTDINLKTPLSIPTEIHFFFGRLSVIFVGVSQEIASEMYLLIPPGFFSGILPRFSQVFDQKFLWKTLRTFF